MNRVFAFGSNMNLRQMFTRCPNATLRGPAVLRDFRIGFGGYSRRWNGAVATIVQDAGSRCYGLLFELTNADLAALDGFEGVPVSYERITVPVRRSGAKRAQRSFAYRLCEHDDDARPGVPSAEYLGVIWDAYREWGFDAAGLAEAVERGCRGKPHLDGVREYAWNVIRRRKV